LFYPLFKSFFHFFLFSAVVLTILGGCETDSFVDPSRTGYFETTPSAMPILNRIDVIEQASDGPEFVNPSPADLKPGDLSYRFAPGDVLRVQIPSLMQTGQTEIAERVVNQTGDIQLPVINKVQAAGLTTEQLQKNIEEKLQGIIKNPKAFVSLQEGRAFQFRILGSVDQPGLYALNKPDLRLLDALATARGASSATSRILVTREVIAEENKAFYNQTTSPETDAAQSSAAPAEVVAPTAKTQTTTPAPSTPSVVDIDQLINELPNANEPTAPPTPAPASVDPTSATPPTPAPASVDPTSATPPTPAPTSVEPTPTAPSTPAPTSVEPTPTAPPVQDPGAEPLKRRTQLGLLRAESRQAPPVDIDDLEQAKADDRVGQNTGMPPATNTLDATTGDQYIFDNASQSWVRKSFSAAMPNQSDAASATNGSATSTNPSDITSTDAEGAKLKSNEAAEALSKKRVIAKQEKSIVIDISYNDLVRGQANLNIVIRPGDLIYCDSGQVGVVYIDGEISRPGVYNLPTSGRLTLSRLVAAAGGVSELAIPERCDLIRRLGSDKEACVRISLAAIRNRAEPDVFLKPDDHIIVGTNFWALPLARFRRDLSFPNSVGFQLDRNFGNDVFGAPPTGVNIN
jgi:protein involved in polysaccharide export with SLBB domain